MKKYLMSIVMLIFTLSFSCLVGCSGNTDYTVTFYDEDGTTILATESYSSGGNLRIPTAEKTSDNVYVYTFEKWVLEKDGDEPADLSEITADIKVYAKYSKEYIDYTVTFYDEDGTSVLGTRTAHYGESITEIEPPEKTSDNEYNYTFEKWVTEQNSDVQVDLSEITANINVYAKYSEEYIDYTVTFYDEDGTSVLGTRTAHYGESITEIEAPEKASDNEYNYTFEKWVTEQDGSVQASFENIVENYAVYASYVKTNRLYTVIWKNVDGSVLETDLEGYNSFPSFDRLHYGDEIVWDVAPSAVMGDITYTATSVVVLYDKKMKAGDTEGEYVTYGEINNTGAYYYFDGKGSTAFASADITIPESTDTIGSLRVGITATNGRILNGAFDNKTTDLGTLMSTQFCIFEKGVYTALNTIGWIARDWNSSADPDYSLGNMVFTNESNTHNLTVVLENNIFYFFIDGAYVARRDITHNNISRDNGATSKYQNGDEFSFGLYAISVGNTIISFNNVKIYYNEEADTAINSLYSVSDGSINGVGMLKANGSYYAIGAGSTLRAFEFTSPETLSDTAVYSVKISANKTLENCGNVPNVGLVLTNKEVLSVNSIYKSIQIGLNQFGLISHTVVNTGLGNDCISMGRRLDVASGNRWDVNTNENANLSMSGTNIERTLTVILYDDYLYIYVDGVFIKRLAITDSAYFNTGLSAGGQYTFGVNAVDINPNTNRVKITVLTEKYGNDAISEIAEKYSSEIYIEEEGASDLITRNPDGTYTQSGVGGTAGYYYLPGEASSTVVLSAKFTLNRVPDLIANHALTSGVGFTICATDLTNKTTNSYQLYATGESLQGLINHGEGKMGVNENAIITSEKLTFTMTLIIKDGGVRLFIDGVEFTGAMLYDFNGGTRYNFPTTVTNLVNSNVAVRVGIATHRLGSATVNVTDITYLTGEAAATEINENDLYN